MFPFYDLEKELFPYYIPIELSWKVEILGAVDVSVEDLDILAPSHPSYSQKNVFLVGFSHLCNFLSLFVAELSPKLSQELEIRYVHLV